MEEQMVKFEEKIDTLIAQVHSIDKTLVRNTVTLEEHVRRTNILEKEIKPIKAHVAMVHGGVKLMGLTGVLLSIILAVLKLTRAL